MLATVFFCYQASAATITYTYDNLNRLKKVDYGNGATIEYTYDAAGNRLTLVSVGDTTAPTTPTLSSPANNSSINDNTPTFDWTDVTDTSGVTYELQVDNDSTFATPDISQTGLTASTYTLTIALSDGLYYWKVRSKDGAGNTGLWTTSWNVRVDTTAPDTTITNQPSNLSNSTSASFSFTSTETGSTFQCQMDAGGYSAWTSPKSYTGLTSVIYSM